MKIVMIGSGYVGLVSGACFAEFGNKVTCIDVDKSKSTALGNGEIGIYEPSLEQLVQKNIREGHLLFTESYSHALEQADIVFIAVGTPSRRGDGHADLSYVYQAAKDLARHLTAYALIVIKSTVPVGTTRQVKSIIKQENPDADFDIASNPEFLREGIAVTDFMQPDRVIIGVDSLKAEEMLKRLYHPLYLAETPIVAVDFESAELIKYASNAFLATKISFINEISALCEATGADVHSVAKGMGLDKRISPQFLNAGPGYGGSCFPKDSSALIKIFREYSITSYIVEATIKANENQKSRMVKKIREAMGNNLSGKKIAVLGLTFKPETDDMRDAPALDILPALAESGAIIHAHDPRGLKEARKLLADSIVLCDNIKQTTQDADATVLMTEWNAYKSLDLKELYRSMSGNIFCDLRNIYEPNQMAEAGFKYFCVGRQ